MGCGLAENGECDAKLLSLIIKGKHRSADLQRYKRAAIDLKVTYLKAQKYPTPLFAIHTDSNKIQKA